MKKEKPIRVLQVIHRMRPGGAQALVMNAYRKADRSQVQFDFAVRSTQEEYHDQEIKSLGGRIFHLPWKKANPISPILYKKALAQILCEHGPFSVVHSHIGFYSGFVLPTAKKQNIPIRIAHSHNTTSTERYSAVLGAWEKLMRRQILSSATNLLACNKTAAGWLFGSQWQKDRRTEIIHNAVKLSDYEMLSQKKNTFRKELGFPLEAPLLGHIGRFDTQKNHSFLIEIMATLVQQTPEAHLLLIGEGELFHQTKSLVQERGLQDNVHFLGIRGDIPSILRSLDLFLLPSLYEGLAIVLIEAQAAGTPCLISDNLPKEVDINIGLIEYESLKADTNQWAKKINKIIATPTNIPWVKRKEALQKGKYTIASVLETFIKLYTRNNEYQ